MVARIIYHMRHRRSINALYEAAATTEGTKCLGQLMRTLEKEAP